MLVHEGRMEVTTKGGLDAAGNKAALADAVGKLRDAGLIVSAFIDADPAQVDAAADVGFSVCEIHTGPYAHAFHEHGRDAESGPVVAELARIADAGRRIIAADMRFNAGHALNYNNVGPIAALPGIRELHIGHAIISRAIFVGLRNAVAQMKRMMTQATTL